jgi:hypothetical protein
VLEDVSLEGLSPADLASGKMGVNSKNKIKANLCCGNHCFVCFYRGEYNFGAPVD